MLLVALHLVVFTWAREHGVGSPYGSVLQERLRATLSAAPMLAAAERQTLQIKTAILSHC